MKKYIQIAIGIFLVVLLTWLLFRNTDWSAVYLSIREVKIRWLVLSQVFAWSSYFARVQRWTYVVRAAHPATFRSMFSSTQIGFLLNFTVPARLGEVVRAYVLARLEKLPLSQCVTMVALDRVNDILSLFVVLFISLLSFPKDRNIELAAGVANNAEPFVVTSNLIQLLATNLTVFFIVILALLILLYIHQTLVLRIIDVCAGLISKRLAERFRKLFLNFAAGMHIFRSASEQTKSFFFSLLTWGASLLSIAAVLTAFAIDFPWFTPFIMLSMIAVLISVPVTPGVVGQYHIAIVASLLLVMPGMEPVEAKAVAIVTHLLSLIPIAAMGIFCLFWERLNFIDLVRV